MKHYIQLTLEERYGIYALLKTGHTQLKIAKVIGVDKSTLAETLKETPANAQLSA